MDRGNRIRILVVEDQAILRDMLADWVESGSRYELVAVESTLAGARSAIASRPIDLVILDLMLPDGNGLTLVRELESRPVPRFVLLTANEQPWIVREATRSKAAGIVMKGAPLDDLRRVVDSVARGEVATCRRTSAMLRDRTLHEPLHERLTAREREILTLVARGASSRVIAQALGIREKTVQNHRANLMDKLGIHDIPGLVRYAIAEGLAVAPDAKS